MHLHNDNPHMAGFKLFKRCYISVFSPASPLLQQRILLECNAANEVAF